MSETTVGIDFGSNYSCVAIVDDPSLSQSSSTENIAKTVQYTDQEKRVKALQQKITNTTVIMNENGNRSTISCIGFSPNTGPNNSTEILIGDAATTLKEKVYADVLKSLLGVEYNQDLLDKVLSTSQFVSSETCQFVATEDSHFGMKIFDTLYSIEELVSMVLQQMKQVAETFLGKKVTQCVLNVPVDFSHKQRKSLTRAAQKADMHVLRLLSDPVAAMIAYQLDMPWGNSSISTERDDMNVLVLDIGSTSSRLSLCSVLHGLMEIRDFEILDGAGGYKFDEEMIQFCLAELKKKFRKIENEKNVIRKLRVPVQNAKIALTMTPTATIFCESLIDGVDFSLPITRARFEILVEKHLNQITVQNIEKVLKRNNIPKEKVDLCIIAGGGGQIIKVESLIYDFFKDCTQFKVEKSITPTEVFTIGSATEAFFLNKQSKEQVKHAPIKVDVTPFDIGVEVTGGYFYPIIRRNTRLPITSEEFKLEPNKDGKVVLKLFEGERMFVQDCRSLGTIQHTVAPAESTTSPAEDVVFKISIDINGNVTTYINDDTVLQVEPSSNAMSAEDVEKLLSDGVKAMEQDEQKKLAVENIRNYLQEIEKRENLMSYEPIKELVQETYIWFNSKLSNCSKDEVVEMHHNVHNKLKDLRKQQQA